MPRTALVWLGGVLGVGVIGGLDYFSGVELRLFPMYYLPISLVAWYLGRRGALVTAALSTLTWVLSNYLADLTFSSSSLWVMNTAMQATSFSVVGLLIARIHESLEHERVLSRTDSLTQLLNTRAFYEEGARLLALCRRNGRPITMAFLDLDNFKTVNDRHGHEAGDRLLHGVATVLRTSLRPSDLAARVGGDEFAVLLPEAGADTAHTALERLRHALATTFVPTGGIVSASIGAASFAQPPATVEEMLREADARMYRAKAAGKNRLLLEAAVTG